jgi:hypothetical protein
MKKVIFICLMIFGSLAAQEPNKSAEPSRQVPDSVASQVKVNADEFQRVKGLIFNLALENQKLQTKKDLSPLDFGYNLILDNYKVTENNLQLISSINIIFGEIKEAKTIPEVKAILKKHGIK